MTPQQQSALEALVSRTLTPAEVVEIDPLVATADTRRDDLVAAILSRGRTLVVSRQLTDAQFLGAYPGGAIEADAVLGALEEFGRAQHTLSSVVSRAMRALASPQGLDFGNESMRELILALAAPAGPLTQQQVDFINSMATQSAPIAREAVSQALNVAEGRMVL